MPGDLIERFCRGDRLALSRLLSLFARGEQVPETLKALAEVGPLHHPSRVVAITGGGGVGKSTLVGKLIEHIRGQELTVAVLACDPQSPLSGGALLGDRFRMPSRPDDEGVFIRSLATASGRGAVAEHLEPMIRLLELFGFDVIMIETVGAGQGDIAVHELADVVVLLLQPETGDDLQWEKAGVLEVADVVVIHKADLPSAEQAETQVKSMLALTNGRQTPVLRVSAKGGAGIDQLWTTIAGLPLRRRTSPPAAQELLRLVQDRLAEEFASSLKNQDPTFQKILAEWEAGRVSQGEVVHRVLKYLFLDRRTFEWKTVIRRDSIGSGDGS